MTRILAICIVGASLAACTAPQGKRLSDNSALPAVASGPATKAATLRWPSSIPDEMVNLKHSGTVTVMLDSIKASGNEWRLSQIPDPTVLKLASHEYIPSESASPKGTEKWVFQATGPGRSESEYVVWESRPRSAGFHADLQVPGRSRKLTIPESGERRPERAEFPAAHAQGGEERLSVGGFCFLID